MRSRTPAILFIAESLILCAFFGLPSSVSAQSAGVNRIEPPKCTEADVDTHVQFLNEPPDYYVILIDKQNISTHSCVVDPLLEGLNFVPDLVQGQPRFEMCFECERPSNERYRRYPALILEPGQVARQRFRWKTTQLDQGRKCLQPNWFSGAILFAARSLIKQVCSNVDMSRFSIVEAPPVQSPKFKVTSANTTSLAGEWFSLHIEGDSPSAESPDSCSTFYLRHRSPSGFTRIDEIRPLVFKTCPSFVPGFDKADWQTGPDIDSGANSRWEGLGEHVFEVFQLTGTADAPHLSSSNILRIRIADPAGLPRTWGTRVNGVRVDITTDKDTFRLGEDVPLHIAVENFDADVPVYGANPTWDPCVVVGIEVQDIQGRPVVPDEGASGECMGHSGLPMQYEKGKIFPIERSLRSYGLPKQPGTYRIVITWQPCLGLLTDSLFHVKCANTARASDSVTIRIVARE